MSRKILLIEDEEKIARFVELELTHEGYEVTKSFNGREGLTLAESGEYELILLDVMRRSSMVWRSCADCAGLLIYQSSCSLPGMRSWTKFPVLTPERTTISPSLLPSKNF